jgi:hypothetical protein
VTIRRGEPWGSPGVLGREAPVASTDAELAEAVRAGATTVGLLGGDLCRTVGGRGDRSRLYDGSGMVLPIDVGVARLEEGSELVFVAHLVVRRHWWFGPLAVAMNAQFLGNWDVAPRSHPNDGRLDVLDAELSVADRWKARWRLPTGSHVPHPGIRERRVRDTVLEFASPMPVRLDGVLVGRARRIAVHCRPDAIAVVV